MDSVESILVEEVELLKKILASVENITGMREIHVRLPDGSVEILKLEARAEEHEELLRKAEQRLDTYRESLV